MELKLKKIANPKPKYRITKNRLNVAIKYQKLRNNTDENKNTRKMYLKERIRGPIK